MGQALKLISRSPGMASLTPTAPVTPPTAAGMPPKEAQVPTAIVAKAFVQTSLAMSMAVRPPMVQ